MATSRTDAPITPIPSSVIIDFSKQISKVDTMLGGIQKDIEELKNLRHPKACLHGENHGNVVQTSQQKINDLRTLFYITITMLITLLGSGVGYVMKSTENNTSMMSNIHSIQVDVDEHTKLLTKLVDTINASKIKEDLNNINYAKVVDIPMVELAPLKSIKKRSHIKNVVMRDGGI